MKKESECDIMVTLLAVFVLWLGFPFILPGLCCGVEKYKTRDGRCCSKCRKGTVVQRDCTPQSDTQCRPCEPGKFMNRPNGLNLCFQCTSCDPDTVVQRDCTPQSDTQCRPCEPGTFMNQRNGKNKCFQCTSCHPVHGLFAKKNCTETSDTVCDALSGYYCRALVDDAGCSLAERHSNCAPGQRIKVPGTSRNDTVCEDCPPGYFSKDGVNCTAWTICSENQVKDKEGSINSDVVCRSASRHRYTLLLLLPFSLLVIFSILVATRATNRDMN